MDDQIKNSVFARIYSRLCLPCLFAGGLFIFSLPAQNYRFICNGFLADGSEREDHCGVCDLEHAPKWSNPNISVVVDTKVLPEGLSKDDWMGIVQDSFSVWNSVSGTNLRLFIVDQDSKREFGSNPYLHEIMWITDIDEWREFTGGGAYLTLAATVPRYNCGEEFEGRREIFDADMVLNGTGLINWKRNCDEDEEECSSIQATLVHELGHFFGIDHPCVLCSTSVMSARAGFDIKFPLFDDMEAVRALYPDGELGGFLSTCKNNADCDGMECIFHHGSKYCSKRCNVDEECEHGTICSESGRCIFMTSDNFGKKRGEKCSRSPCVESLICAGPAEDEFYCYEPCTSDADCLGKEECMAVSRAISLCLELSDIGEECTSKKFCRDDLVCVFENESFGICRKECQKTLKNREGCGPKERCFSIERSLEVCMPYEPDIKLDDASSGFSKSSKTLDPVIDENSITPSKQSINYSCGTGQFAPEMAIFMVFIFMIARGRNFTA